MRFVWDEAKHQRNVRDRGYGFDYAAHIFDGPVRQWEDTRFSYPEVRIIAVGRVEGRFLTVVYTDADDARRIISSWPSNRKERRRWAEIRE